MQIERLGCRHSQKPILESISVKTALPEKIDDFGAIYAWQPSCHDYFDDRKGFLAEILRLELHPKKVIIKKLSQGIDFVGYVLFERHVLSRTRTNQRMKRRLKEEYENYYIGKITAQALDQRLQSYLELLSHANQFELSTALKNAYWMRDETGKVRSS